MIKLREARITDGVPKIVAAQPWVQVLSEVYAELQGRVLDCLDAGVTFSEVDKCSEETLDQMAVYLKVEWYDSAADLETKRRIIKTAIEIQRYAGTVKAVREQVSVTYPDSEVEEWFDYGGTPGFWRLNVNITDAPAQYHTMDGSRVPVWRSVHRRAGSGAPGLQRGRGKGCLQMDLLGRRERDRLEDGRREKETGHQSPTRSDT